MTVPSLAQTQRLSATPAEFWGLRCRLWIDECLDSAACLRPKEADHAASMARTNAIFAATCARVQGET